MRIVKLSSSDPDMVTIEAVHEYFNDKLAARQPQGKFLLTKGRIKSDGLSIGEIVVFTYKANLVYFAFVSQEVTQNEDPDSSEYPSYFCIDLATLTPCTGTLSEFNQRLIQQGVTDKKFGGQGWVQVPSAESNPNLESFLIPFISHDATHVTVIGRVTETVARVGQQKFRKNLIEMWGCCAVTALDIETLLVASHIKPWSKANSIEKLDCYNGLLLAPHLDALFDKGFITFDSNGKIQISNELIGKEKMLGITPLLKLSKVTENHKKYLSWHRNELFRGKKT